MRELDYTTKETDPLEFVLVPQDEGRPLPYPPQYRDRIMLDVIHDGRVIPETYLVDSNDRRIPEEVFLEHYVRERDWGASLVAHRLAERLRLPGFFRVTTARCLIDFGRFPGSTPPQATHLSRFAINYPFSELLGFSQKRALLESQYDRISEQMDAVLQNGCLIKIALHTYDMFNESGTMRPHVSLVTRSLAYQNESRMPQGVFDPMFPDVLAEFTSNRTLRDRISLNLHKSGVPVAQNYPYLLPEGSPEVRSQVWSFFKYLRKRFQADHPDTEDIIDYQLVWEMLLDTNLRSSGSELLRSFLHMYRRPPKGRVREFARAEKAYQEIALYCRNGGNELIQSYKRSDDRISAIGVEVRKDLVWKFDKKGQPIEPAPEQGLQIADRIAEAVITYLNEDRAEEVIGSAEFGQKDPWYAPSSKLGGGRTGEA